MLIRASARHHPRVGKQARSLARAGCRVVVVAAKLPGEARPVERLGPGVVAVRTTTGWVSAARRKLGIERKTGPTSDAVPQAEPGDLPAWRLGLMLVSRCLLAVRMALLARRVRPDVVHAHDFSTLPAGWLASRLCRIPLVYDAHEVNLDREGYYRQLVRIIAWVEGCLIRRCDRVITTTGLRARHFRRVYRLRRTPAVLQNRPEYHPTAMPPVDLRARFTIAPDALLCLYQGGLQAGRGLHNLIAAVAATEGVHLVLLGGGQQQQALRAHTERFDGASRIHLLEQVGSADVAAFTRAADVGAQVLRNTCFNHWSTDSNKLFEYAQAGLAVIASDFPEIRRIVQAYDFGVLVDPHDISAIGAALARLRDDRMLLARLRGNAVRAAPMLDWGSQEPLLLDLYAELGVIGR
jgi:glycosyltransferase involved in cell wall biosynthesis